MKSFCAEEGIQRALFKLGVHPYKNVFKNGHGTEQADILESTRNAAFRYLVWPQADQGTIVEVDLSFVGRINSSKRVKKCCFSGAVGANNACDTPWFE